MAQLKSVYPISDEDLTSLPVKAIGPAVAYYEAALGFSVVRADEATATLNRDAAQIGLVAEPTHDPKTAGSLAFSVDDLDVLHDELLTRGANPGKFGTDSWGGERYRTFFVREDEDGYCYCFFQPAE